MTLLLDGLVEQRVIAEVDHLELDELARREGGEPVEHLRHRLGARLKGHGARVRIRVRVRRRARALPSGAI